MFHNIKPGHILRFPTCPSSIGSPKASDSEMNDNTLETLWPAEKSYLGLVQCYSHPSGDIGKVAADVATRLRGTPDFWRSASYSTAGRYIMRSDRLIGTQDCDFVGYVDGRSNYIQSTKTVFSKDFSGCLMVAYTLDGQRRVAHVATSKNPKMDCKQAFLRTIQGHGAVLSGWFKPYSDNSRNRDPSDDCNNKVRTYTMVERYIHNILRLTMFGVVTTEGEAFAIGAFKPIGITGNDWVVTSISPKTMNQTWDVP